MKIAVIFSGNSNIRTGIFNHVIQRVEILKKKQNVKVDVFFIQKRYSWLFRLLKKIKVEYEAETIVNDIRIKNIWVKESLWSYLLTHRFKLKAISCKSQLSKYAFLFKGYDLLSTNGLLDSYLAKQVNSLFGTPFVITWHGSDINIYPYRSKKTYKLIYNLLRSSSYNFFVSKYLMNKSEKIFKSNKKDHMYIGPNELFYEYSIDKKQKLRERYNVKSKYVVGFVGNMKPIKNVELLPDIFKILQTKIKDIHFILVGQGTLLDNVKLKSKNHQIINTTYTGAIDPKKIPDIMNIINVLVLPSKSEGLGLVAIEAKRCGAHVVGSKVGGIPEVIGDKNSFELDDKFIDNISTRIVEILLNSEKSKILSNDFDLNNAVEKELQIYKKLIYNE